MPSSPVREQVCFPAVFERLLQLDEKLRKDFSLKFLLDLEEAVEDELPKSRHSAMFNNEDSFDAIFGSKPDLAYSQHLIADTQKHRRKLENELFFEKLLKSIGVSDPSALYPCASNASLRTLYDTIVASTAPAHQISSLIYYLIKDLPQSATTATKYAATRPYLIPVKYRIYIDGVWALDHLDLQSAISHLTHPNLTKAAFPEEILYAICILSKASDPSPALKFFESTSPRLTSKKQIAALFTCFLRANVTEAFHFARKYSVEIHKMLFEQLITFVHADAGGELRGRRAVELLALPVNPQEIIWCKEFLANGKGKSLFGAKDTLIMMGVEQGDFEHLEGGKAVDGVSWSVLGQGSK